MWRSIDMPDSDESAMRHEILAFLDVYCRGKTLQDAREWYAEAFLAEAPPSGLGLNKA